MTRIVFDIETDNLLDEMTKVHCIVIRNLDTDLYATYVGNDIEIGLRSLEMADEVWGHNIIDFDLRALKKAYPRWPGVPRERVYDSLLSSRLSFPEIIRWDYGVHIPAGMPAKLAGRHSLESWGYRVGIAKTGLDIGFDTLTPELLQRCITDTSVNQAVIERCTPLLPPKAWATERELIWTLQWMEETGFPFAMDKAITLAAELRQREHDLRSPLVEFGGSWFEPVGGEFVPKRDNKTRGYVAGVPCQKIQRVTFNPSSRVHIAKRLTEEYGWKPTEFTDKGQAIVDEKMLATLDYPVVPKLIEYFDLTKRIGYVDSWMKSCGPSSSSPRIHGRINQLGTATGRASHMNPNLGQVPSEHEYRELFAAPPGRVLVGVDMSGVELRMLAHFMSKHDEGEYGRLVCEGDVHQANADAWGVDRKTAKTGIYALIYGAGDTKLGYILKQDGRKARAKLMDRFPALLELTNAVKRAARERGYLKGLDGRRLPVRSEHSALNTVLQSAGAVASKVWFNLATRSLCAEGLDWVPTAYVHDEIVVTTTQDHAESVKEQLVSAIILAGIDLKLSVPLAGEGRIGNNWSEIH